MVYKVKQEKKPPLLCGHLNMGGTNGRDEIALTSRYLQKNGRPWIPVMGELHYVRVPRERWAEELQKMKAGGIDTVAAYVIWNYHEQEEGVFRFDGNRDIRRFLAAVRDCGLYAVLRIGPWIHGEVRNGGFPDWLLQKGIPLRENNEEYFRYVIRYWQKVSSQVGEFLFENGGNIWAMQLENELVHRPEHLLALKHLAIELGLRAPVYTVTGWNRAGGAMIPETEVLPVFGGYPEAPWEPHKEQLAPSVHYFFQPERNDSGIGADLLPLREAEGGNGRQEERFCIKYDRYPFATCELGGGIPATAHRRPLISADDVAALAMVKLGCGNNLPGYYMYHGGINDLTEIPLQESRATGYPNDYPVREYDFQAPVGCHGQMRDSYRKLRLQHLFLKAFGSAFAEMQPYFQEKPVTRGDRESLRYSMRTDGKSGYVFVNNYQRLDELSPHENVRFCVPCADGGTTSARGNKDWPEDGAAETGCRTGDQLAEDSAAGRQQDNADFPGRTLVFPEEGLYIPSGAYFFLPWHMELDGLLLKYATAQPLYRKGNAWFFFTPSGIRAQYRIIPVAGCAYQGEGECRTYHIPEGRSTVLRLDRSGRLISEEDIYEDEAETLPPAAGAEKEAVQIVTLSQTEAERFCVVDGHIYLTFGADVYEPAAASAGEVVHDAQDETGNTGTEMCDSLAAAEIVDEDKPADRKTDAATGRVILRREGCADLSCAVWNGSRFVWERCYAGEKCAGVRWSILNRPQPGYACQEELFLNGRKPLLGASLSFGVQTVEPEEYYLVISYVGDILQIYVDGLLVFDEFYKGSAPKIDLYEILQHGRHAELWISELREGDCYLECTQKAGLEIKEIRLEPVYRLEYGCNPKDCRF